MPVYKAAAIPTKFKSKDQRRKVKRTMAQRIQDAKARRTAAEVGMEPLPMLANKGK